jgi:hypothetical protein
MSIERKRYEVAAERKNDRTINICGAAASCCCGSVSIDKLDVTVAAAPLRAVRLFYERSVLQGLMDVAHEDHGLVCGKKRGVPDVGEGHRKSVASVFRRYTNRVIRVALAVASKPNLVVLHDLLDVHVMLSMFGFSACQRNVPNVAYAASRIQLDRGREHEHRSDV